MPGRPAAADAVRRRAEPLRVKRHVPRARRANVAWPGLSRAGSGRGRCRGGNGLGCCGQPARAEVELVEAPVVVVVTGLEVLEAVDGGTSEVVVADGRLVVVEFCKELVVLVPDGEVVLGEPLGPVLPGELPAPVGGLLPGLVVVVESSRPGWLCCSSPTPSENHRGTAPGLPLPVPPGTPVDGLV